MTLETLLHEVVPRPTVNEILAGKRSVSNANAVRLAQFFGEPIGEFIG